MHPLIAVARQAFKTTGRKPTRFSLDNDEGGSCIIGAIFVADGFDVPWEVDDVQKHLRLKHNVNLQNGDIGAIYFGWDTDTYTQNPLALQVRQLYKELTANG